MIIKDLDSNIRTVNIFDVFEGGNLPDDKKSIAINVSIQADDKTLSDSDLNQISKKIIKEIRGKGLWLGVEIDPNYVSGKELSKMCLDAGILCKETHETTIRYAPPLVITKEELDWGIEKIKAVFSKITS